MENLCPFLELLFPCEDRDLSLPAQLVGNKLIWKPSLDSMTSCGSGVAAVKATEHCEYQCPGHAGTKGPHHSRALALACYVLRSLYAVGEESPEKWCAAIDRERVAQVVPCLNDVYIKPYQEYMIGDHVESYARYVLRKMYSLLLCEVYVRSSRLMLPILVEENHRNHARFAKLTARKHERDSAEEEKGEDEEEGDHEPPEKRSRQSPAEELMENGVATQCPDDYVDDGHYD